MAPPPGGPRLVWGEYNAAGVSSALRDLMGLETLDSDCAYTDAERRCRQPVVRDGLRWLRRNFPETFPVFCNAVPILILAKKDAHAGGGVSSRTGLVWLAPSSSWTGHDCGEHLFHEYVHQCLFLEDMVRTVFRRDPYAMSEPKNMIVSAIRGGQPRRYDQSYHSAFVAAGIVEYRARVSDISGARALLPALWPCLDALARKRDFLTDNGAEQLDQLIECTIRQSDQLSSREPPASRRRRGEPLDPEMLSQRWKQVGRIHIRRDAGVSVRRTEETAVLPASTPVRGGSRPLRGSRLN